MISTKGAIGYACAYTPLPLITAAGFTPHRILPVEDCPDQAGRILHDNLCPHVKRILDMALSGALPGLSGMVFMNSCDSMRRLHDAFRTARSDISTVLVDLPPAKNESAVGFFSEECARLAKTLESWGGDKTTGEAIAEAVTSHNRLCGLFDELRRRMHDGTLQGGAAALQEAYNMASTRRPEEGIEELSKILSGTAGEEVPRGVPVYLFGNVLPQPEAFTLFESCGARIVSEDVCTGSRAFSRIETRGGDAMHWLAEGILRKPPCARTFDTENPGGMAESVVAAAKSAGAKGVIGYTAKFCDPYIARMPGVRQALRREGIPFLLLEGDCTLRSIGQQATRIEAFIEMMR